ncbi:MAG: ABC transporter ATP-binding protein [Planctomycetota bacterium]|nr:ABC transporter ATP-binding protein [Planctomycetota bacterium]
MPSQPASPTSTGTIAQLKSVERTYVRGSLQVHALKNIEFQLQRKEFVALTGHSGCGKSTLLNLISGVDCADAGEVVVCGEDLRTASESQLTILRRRHIGVVFQDFQLMPNLTALENVALPLALDGGRDPERVLSLLARVGLDHRSRNYPSELSGGEQQRVAVARALVHRPELIVADEPTGNLDSTRSLQILELLMELRLEEGAALVLATHDRAIAARADREIQLRDGEIISEVAL